MKKYFIAFDNNKIINNNIKKNPIIIINIIYNLFFYNYNFIFQIYIIKKLNNFI